MGVSKKDINHSPAFGLKSVLINCFLIVTTLQRIQAHQNDCVTVDNQPGICKRVDHCKEYWNMLPNPSEAQIELLKRANCGWAGRKPKVCCAASGKITPSEPYVVENEIGPVFETISNEISEYDTGTGTAAKFPLLPTDCGREPVSSRISNGNKTSLMEFPWMALLQYSDDGETFFSCGGMLINDQYVLTAAHCIPGVNVNLTTELSAVRLGEHTISTDPDFIRGQGFALPVQIIDVEKTIAHPLYDHFDPHKFHDIAMIRLKTKAKRSAFVRPICLLNKNQVIPIGTKHFVAGWGLTEDYVFSNEKLKAQVHTMSFESCKMTYASRYTQVIDESVQICAIGEAGRDACLNDSGGPLMQPIINYEIGEMLWHASGLIAYGPAYCGTKDVPSIYTNIPGHLDWIISNLEP